MVENPSGCCDIVLQVAAIVVVVVVVAAPFAFHWHSWSIIRLLVATCCDSGTRRILTLASRAAAAARSGSALRVSMNHNAWLIIRSCGFIEPAVVEVVVVVVVVVVACLVESREPNTSS